MTNKKKIDPIPEEFNSYEEAAEFWDTHDTTDYPENWHPFQKGKTMQPEIVTRPAFKAVGYLYLGKNQNAEISQMWERFGKRINEPRRVDSRTAYGLCFMGNPDAGEGEFEYVAAVEVADNQSTPAGMVYREVPEYKYAVFTHQGKLDNLRDTYDYIFKTGVSQTGLQFHPSGFNMEVYTEEFILNSDDSKFYIYVAVQ